MRIPRYVFTILLPQTGHLILYTFLFNTTIYLTLPPFTWATSKNAIRLLLFHCIKHSFLFMVHLDATSHPHSQFLSTVLQFWHLKWNATLLTREAVIFISMQHFDLLASPRYEGLHRGIKFKKEAIKCC